MIRRYALSLMVLLGLGASSLRAQESAAMELLGRVPEELGICLAVNDAGGQIARWRKTTWWPKLKDNPLVQGFLASKEFRDLSRFEDELKRHLDIDFAFLRDDVLGDAVVFAYQPAGLPDGSVERGLLLVKAKRAESLASLIAKVNELQTNAGELTSLEERKHKDQTYYRRVHQRATHFYYHKGPFLAISSREELLLAMLDRGDGTASTRRDQLKKARVKNAAVSLWVNPRLFDAEWTNRAATKSGPEAVIAQALSAFWKGLDGIVVTLEGDDTLEARLTLSARPDSEAHRLWSVPATAPVGLWRHFPDNALIAAAVSLDFAKIAKTIRDTAPEPAGRHIDAIIQKNVSAVTGLDAYVDILPNLGPDLGFALLPAEKGGMPLGLVALAAKSAPKESPTDQTLLKAAHFFVGLALYEHNRKNAEPIRVKSAMQEGIEVRYLVQDKLFPPGIRPALALKAGYLVLASSPEAIAAFKSGEAASASDETPLVKIAPREWSRLMKTHREMLIDHLVTKNNDPPATAATVVDGFANGFDAFQSLVLSQRTGDGVAAWIVRLTPTKTP